MLRKLETVTSQKMHEESHLMIGINFEGEFRDELLSPICPTLTNSLLPLLVVAKTFTDDEPSEGSPQYIDVRTQYVSVQKLN